MSDIIGADAAKLAGLQIDQLSKIRSGQLSLDHLERFLNLPPEGREERFGDWKRPAPIVEQSKPVVLAEPVTKFALLVDLGIITVPKSYAHATCLYLFKERYQRGERNFFLSYNDDITDSHFSNPTRVLKPGDRLTVRAFQQIVERTTSEERMEFLRTQNAVLTGAQGAALVFEEKRDKLPRAYWYASLDEKERLWQDFSSCSRVPGMNVFYRGDFSLGYFESAWHQNSALLVFYDVPAPSGA